MASPNVDNLSPSQGQQLVAKLISANSYETPSYLSTPGVRGEHTPPSYDSRTPPGTPLSVSLDPSRVGLTFSKEYVPPRESITPLVCSAIMSCGLIAYRRPAAVPVSQPDSTVHDRPRFTCSCEGFSRYC